MRVQLRHLIEQLLVGCRGFLHPIEVLQVMLGVLDRSTKRASCLRFLQQRRRRVSSPAPTGLPGNIWCPDKVSKILKTAPRLVVIFVKSRRGGNLTPLVNSALGASTHRWL
jgi:hypothetical protein